MKFRDVKIPPKDYVAVSIKIVMSCKKGIKGITNFKIIANIV